MYKGHLRNLRAFLALSTIWRNATGQERSCPLSDLAQRHATGAMSYRNSFGGVVSDLRSPGSVGRPAGASVGGGCAGDRKVETNMFRAPGTYMPSRFRCVFSFGGK